MMIILIVAMVWLGSQKENIVQAAAEVVQETTEIKEVEDRRRDLKVAEIAIMMK